MTTLDALVAKRAARLDPLDLPRTLTQREMDAYVEETVRLDRQISTVSQAESALADLAPLEPDMEWKDFLVATRPVLCAELEVMSPHDKRRQNLELSIITIDRGLPPHTGYSLNTLRLGQLMREAGYTPMPPIDGEIFGRMPWFGDVRTVERRIAENQKRRAIAQATLDEALLDDDERERHNAALAAEVARRNALPQRKFRGDGSVYLKWPDGRIEEVTV